MQISNIVISENSFPFEIRNETTVSFVTTLERLEEKQGKVKGETNLSLFADDVIVYEECLKESTSNIRINKAVYMYIKSCYTLDILSF